MSENNVDEQVEDKFGTDVDPMEGQDAASSDLAEKALAEAEEGSEKPAEESAEKPEDRPTVETVAKLREQRRDERDARHAAELETAEIRGKMAGMQERQTVEATLSPVQTAMKEQGITSEAELDLTTGETMVLMRQEQKWEAAQTAKTTAADAETTRQSGLKTHFDTEVAMDRGEGLDYRTVIKMGEKFLNKYEMQQITESDNPYDTGYRLCIRAIRESGDESTKSILQERLARKTKESAEGDTSEKKNKVVPDEDETDDEKGDEPIANPRLRWLAAEQVGGGSGSAT